MSEPAAVVPDERWVLAVDFGTTNTVAAIGEVNGGLRVLSIDGNTIMPSAVLLDSGSARADKWFVGRSAINSAQLQMEWFEASPKRCIPDGSVFLGGRNVPVVDAVAAVLRVVVDEAAAQQGSRPPATFVVTHPANWPEAQIAVLKDAARTVAAHHQGWPAPEPLSEPVAAAERMLEVVELPAAARIVVLDLGGGTVDAATIDIATVDAPDTGAPERVPTVVGRPTRIDGAGGEDFDYRLAAKMAEEAGAPGLYQRLADSTDPDEQERAFHIRSRARAVKEELSRQVKVPTSVPKSPPDLCKDTPVQVNRELLEELIKGGPGNPPGLANAVALAMDALQDAPLGGPPFAGVYLVGGSSRIPLLGTLVQQQTSRPPITGGDPSTSVADGAATRALRLLPPIPLPPPPPPPWWRRVLVGAAALLVVGGAVAAYIFLPWPPWQTTVPPTSSVVPPPGPVARGDPTLAACPKAHEDDCERKILAAAHAAWPMLPPAVCTVNDPLYGADAYSAECRTSGTTYLVFWRKSDSIVSKLAGQMIMPTTADFVFPGSSEKLGSQVSGTRSTPSGVRYTCAWEYEDHPVTMVIDGPNDNGTLALCGTAELLDSAGMRSALGAG